MTELEDEPFDGLVINGYGIYNESDQKQLHEYITQQLHLQLEQIKEGAIYVERWVGTSQAAGHAESFKAVPIEFINKLEEGK